MATWNRNARRRLPAQRGVVMRERIVLSNQRTAYLEALEKLLRARIGWVNSAISPFARKARGKPDAAAAAPPRTLPIADQERAALTG
jgi:hypothetical protein